MEMFCMSAATGLWRPDAGVLGEPVTIGGRGGDPKEQGQVPALGTNLPRHVFALRGRRDLEEGERQGARSGGGAGGECFTL